MCSTRQVLQRATGQELARHEDAQAQPRRQREVASSGKGGTPASVCVAAQAGGARLAARTIESVRSGTIVAGIPTSSGIAVLVSTRVDGQGWDTAPRVIVAASGSTGRVVTLPAAEPGRPLAQTITASGSRRTMTAFDLPGSAARKLTWTSTDGGSTWSTGG